MTKARFDDTAFETPYPSYDVLQKWDSPSFNPQTRKVIAHRLAQVPERRFFSLEEYSLLRAIMDCILPQPERGEAERIPVEAFVDAAQQAGEQSGTRFEVLPPDPQAWRRGLEAIGREARKRFDKPFEDLPRNEQHDVLKAVDGGEITPEIWGDLPPQKFFRHILLKQSVKIYYGHPLAWNEMGFGGPASPRGYLRLGPDARDPWEAREERLPQKVDNLP